MRWPRWLARLLAALGGYFWIPCPVCGQPFAGFEIGPPGHAVNHRIENGEHVCEVTCQKSQCVAEGARQQQAFFDSCRERRAGMVVHLKP